MTKMKFLLVPFLLFFFLPFVPNTGAQETGCEAHGGVSCQNGPDVDGSVVCNDNWAASPLLYKDATMCWSYTGGTSELLCTPPKPMGCLSNHDYVRKYVKLAREGDVKSPEAEAELLACKRNITEYENALKDYDACVAQYDKKDNPNGDYSLYTYTINNLHSFCHENLGYESKYNEAENRCECFDNYDINPDTGRCELMSLMCIDFFGNSTISSENECRCRNGYEFDWNTYSCKKIVAVEEPTIESIFEENIPRPVTRWTMEQLVDGLNSRINESGRVIYVERPANPPIGFMVKAHSDPKAYLVMPDGSIRWVSSEAAAKRLFGPAWDRYIIWMEESLIYSYPTGKPITE